mmetsp:Transcript_23085/g.34371  ORF Transcript_23085/g.34371 Transcript_23085/m.34371 type:complete len:550 (+) Transcript_23085:142-1791(+)
MKKKSFDIIKACTIAVLLCMLPLPADALSNNVSTEASSGSGSGSDNHPGIKSSPLNNNDTNKKLTPPLSMTDVERHLSSIGTTVDDVCGYHYHRGLNTDGDQVNDAEEGEGEKVRSKQVIYINTAMSIFCVCVAALAAGLTMGLLSQELLDLRIKEKASADLNERKQAQSLVPLIKDHHRLLVTLLLMNAAANEALPLFLDELVPSYVAVILSVTFVLFFGEIIPSAIFTGPNQLAISSKLAPLVRLVLVLLAPLAWPIAKVLDYFLHDEETIEKYDRGELTALVRLQFEERKKAKLLKKTAGLIMKGTGKGSLNHDHPISPQNSSEQSHRFVRHIDEVNMVEGALQMHTKKVRDVMQNWRKVYAIPSDMILNEANILEIFTKGFSRIPVYESGGSRGSTDSTRNIIGVFKARQLAVISAEEERPLSSIHLATPFCVSPTMNMVELLNLLQEGKGQVAIVCMNPQIAEDALTLNKAIPEKAHVVGLVTLEDCIEELIQEEIYDEYDREEKITNYRSKWVIEKWRRFVQKKKAQRKEASEVIDENAQLIV